MRITTRCRAEKYLASLSGDDTFIRRLRRSGLLRGRGKMDGRVSQLFLSPQVITAKDAGKAEPPKDAGVIRAYVVSRYDTGLSSDGPYLSTIRAPSPSCGSGFFTAYAINARFCIARSTASLIDQILTSPCAEGCGIWIDNDLVYNDCTYMSCSNRVWSSS